jgi:hypothetical protein
MYIIQGVVLALIWTLFSLLSAPLSPSRALLELSPRILGRPGKPKPIHTRK